MGRRLSAGWFSGAFAAIAVGATAFAQHAVTPDEVMSGALLGAAPGATTPVAGDEVLALSDEMRAFLDRNVNPGGTDIFKLQQLIDAMMGSADFKLEYDENTRTAAETFRLRRGNCLSFTTLFVALARGAQLDADFQEVDIPPDWSTRRNVFVLNRHVNAIVQLGMSGSRAVDFNMEDFKTTYKVVPIDDRRAIAHYFNNMGVEHMQQGEIGDAVVYFRQAIIESGGDFSPAWTNLGLLYRRAGHLEHAEVAYLQALEVDKGDYVAMSNLVSLYERLGDSERAESYRKKVDQHRMRNPHLRYSLAREAFDAGDIDAAIEHLKYAIRKSKDEAEYCHLLARCYLAKGDRGKADKWSAKAMRLAETDEQKARFASETGAPPSPGS